MLMRVPQASTLLQRLKWAKKANTNRKVVQEMSKNNKVRERGRK